MCSSQQQMKTSLSSTLSLFSPSSLIFFSSLSICCTVPVFSFIAQSEPAPPAGKPSILCLSPAVQPSHHVSDFCQHLLREAAPRSIDGCPFFPKVLLYLLCFSLVTGFWVVFLRKSELMKCYRSFDFNEDCVLLVQKLGNYSHLMVWFLWESRELSVCLPFLKKIKGIFWYFWRRVIRGTCHWKVC